MRLTEYLASHGDERLSVEQVVNYYRSVLRSSREANRRMAFPRLAIISGQAGAGKSTAIKIVKGEFGLEFEPVTVDLDAIRSLHPEYENLFKDNPETAGTATNEAAKFMEDRLLAFAKRRRANIIMETGLRTPANALRIVRRFELATYKVDLHCMAVNSKESTLGVFSRYVGQVQRLGAGRFVPLQFHHSGYALLPQSVALLEDSKAVERVAVYNRQRMLYDNKIVDGDWFDRPAAGLATLKAEREREWTADEKASFADRWVSLEGALQATPNILPSVIDQSVAYAREAVLFGQARLSTAADNQRAGIVVDVTPHHFFVGLDDELVAFNRNPLVPIEAQDLQAGDGWFVRPYPVRIRAPGYQPK